MARAEKKGLDYFPVEVDIFENNAIRIIMAEYDAKGYEIIMRLLCEIYKEGYFCRWGATERLLLKERTNLHEQQIDEIVQMALEMGIFNKDMYSQYKILTSVPIQLQFFFAKKRAKFLHIVPKYLLIKPNAKCIPRNAIIIQN